MTIRALAGLTVFNLLLALVGTAVLAGIRPLSRRDLVRLSGLAYLLGVAALMVVLTLFLVLGIPVTAATIALAGVLILGAGGAVARGRRRSERVPVPSQHRLLSIPGALVLAAAAVSLEAIFRKARLQGLIEFDGWNSWGPRTKELYYTGHLDPHLLATLSGGSYPPGIPAVLAAAMHAMGSADVVTVHVQYWFFAIGFVGALLGLLGGRVRPLILLPFVLLVFVLPDIRSRSVDMYGDLPLGYLIAIAALLVGLWVLDRQAWALPAAAVILAGAVLAKREGILLAACVLVAGLVASADRVRFALPRLGGVLLVAIASYLPWAIWLRAKGLPGNGPQGGLHFLTDSRRAWDALEVVTRNLFDYNLWLLAATGVLVAVALCLLAAAWRASAYGAALFAVLVLVSAGIIWSDSSIVLSDINLVSRLVGTVILCAVAVTPFVLEHAWNAGTRAPERTLEPAPGRFRSRHIALSLAIVLGAAIAYPADLLARGGARFPKAFDCVTQPPNVGSVAVVLGYRSSYTAALELRTRAGTLGAGRIEVAPDGCGRVRVFVSHVESRAAAADLVRRARAAGLSAHLEANPAL